MKEGAGIRTPNRDSIRARMIARFIAEPGCIIMRRDLLATDSEDAVDAVVKRLKCSEIILCERNSSGVGYRLAISPDLLKWRKLPKLPKPKREREWPESHYVAPRPIPISIFDYARTL